MAGKNLRSEIKALVKTYRANAAMWRKRWIVEGDEFISSRFFLKAMIERNDYNADTLEELLEQSNENG